MLRQVSFEHGEEVVLVGHNTEEERVSDPQDTKGSRLLDRIEFHVLEAQGIELDAVDIGKGLDPKLLIRVRRENKHRAQPMQSTKGHLGEGGGREEKDRGLEKEVQGL